MAKISDKERLDTLLEIIRGGKGYVPVSWVDEDGALTALNVHTRRHIDICIRACRRSARRQRKEK